MFEDQGIHVIASILSIFPESREWNRKNLMKYYEVYIDAPIEQLKYRDDKGLYKKFDHLFLPDYKHHENQKFLNFLFLFYAFFHINKFFIP